MIEIKKHLRNISTVEVPNGHAALSSVQELPSPPALSTARAPAVPSRPWARSEEKLLRSLYPKTSAAVLVERFSRSAKAISSRAKLLRLRKDPKVPGIYAKAEWTREQDKLLRKLYPYVATRKLVKQLRHSYDAVFRRAHLLGLRKSQAYLDSPDACRLRRGDNVGAAHRFLPGHAPFNKGLRRPGWHRGRMRETQFKKGQQPRNTMPLWSFRWVDGYMMLKTGAPTPRPAVGWEYVHKLVWEQAHGPIPKGYRIWWKDRDRGNCALSNLELLSGADHMARTTVHNLPPALRQVIQLTGALKRKIRNREEKLYGKEHPAGPAGSPVRDIGISA